MPETYDLDADEAPSDGVFEAIEAADERGLLDLPPLAGAIDPDALDALLVEEVGTREVTFEYAGWLVTATRSAIHLEPLEEE